MARRPMHALAFAGLLALAFLGLPESALAQTDADFSAYCRARFPNSTPVKRPEKWGVEHYCNQGGTLQGIDLGAACEMTTGSRDHEKMGDRVLCAGAPSGLQAPPQGSGAPDFALYCRTRFPNSTHEPRRESWGLEHYCRRPGQTGGFTLQNIDLADACQVTHGTRLFAKLAGGDVVCGIGGAAGAGAGGGGGAGGGAGGGGQVARFNLPPDVANATGVACQALGGEWRSGTMPLVQRNIAEMRRGIQQRAAGCYAQRGYEEQCRRQVVSEQTLQAYFQSITIWQCHMMALNFEDRLPGGMARLARGEACQIGRVLTNLYGQLREAGSPIDTPPHETMQAQSQVGDPCAPR